MCHRSLISSLYLSPSFMPPSLAPSSPLFSRWLCVLAQLVNEPEHTLSVSLSHSGRDFAESSDFSQAPGEPLSFASNGTSHVPSGKFCKLYCRLPACTSLYPSQYQSLIVFSHSHSLSLSPLLISPWFLPSGVVVGRIEICLIQFLLIYHDECTIIFG